MAGGSHAAPRRAQTQPPASSCLLGCLLRAGGDKAACIAAEKSCPWDGAQQAGAVGQAACLVDGPQQRLQWVQGCAAWLVPLVGMLSSCIRNRPCSPALCCSWRGRSASLGCADLGALASAAVSLLIHNPGCRWLDVDMGAPSMETDDVISHMSLPRKELCSRREEI